MQGPPLRAAMALILLLLVAGAQEAAAHGPTVRVALSGVKPEVTTVRLGATVHFHNANASGAVCTVVADDGSFESPPLTRAGGWHHTFETPGSFAFHVKERSGSRGRIVVVED